jgi:hypothetical protein
MNELGSCSCRFNPDKLFFDVGQLANPRVAWDMIPDTLHKNMLITTFLLANNDAVCRATGKSLLFILRRLPV